MPPNICKQLAYGCIEWQALEGLKTQLTCFAALSSALSYWHTEGKGE